MSVANSYKTRPGPDFEKYGRAVLNSLKQQGRKLTDENIEEEGERMAEMLVLDESQLTSKAKDLARTDTDEDAEEIGNIYEGDE